MSARDGGGPAFPVSELRGAEPGTTDEMRAMARGMSLRDYFAAKAMQPMVGCGYAAGAFAHADTADSCAAAAYEIADAMLKARSA
jgi:hypothetical protein